MISRLMTLCELFVVSAQIGNLTVNNATAADKMNVEVTFLAIVCIKSFYCHLSQRKKVTAENKRHRFSNHNQKGEIHGISNKSLVDIILTYFIFFLEKI